MSLSEWAVLETRLATEEAADLIRTLPAENLRDLLVGRGPGALDDDQVQALVTFLIVEGLSGRRLDLDDARRAHRALAHHAREARRQGPERPRTQPDPERERAAASRVLAWCLAVADRTGQ